MLQIKIFPVLIISNLNESIDTGIDYNHPYLGSNGFGPDKKVFVGYDFVGDNFDTADPKPVPDSDPMDCEGHGTHVAVCFSRYLFIAIHLNGIDLGYHQCYTRKSIQHQRCCLRRQHWCVQGFRLSRWNHRRR